jgi:hypothetical protein
LILVALSLFVWLGAIVTHFLSGKRFSTGTPKISAKRGKYLPEGSVLSAYHAPYVFVLTPSLSATSNCVSLDFSRYLPNFVPIVPIRKIKFEMFLMTFMKY